MTKNDQSGNDWWEREHLQRALDYQNKNQRTNIAIKGRAEDIYPCLKGQVNWDWVCYDTETGDEIAVEVKQFTDPTLEQQGNIMWQLAEKVKDNFSTSQELPGTFVITVTIPTDYDLPLRGRNKEKVTDTLYKVICEAGEKLEPHERMDLTPEIIRRTGLKLPDRFFYLRKLSDQDSWLGLCSGPAASFWNDNLDEDELRRFEELVSDANEQLRQATEAKVAMLLIIEEGYRPTHSRTVVDALKRISHESYSKINNIYYVSGTDVAEIPLPTH